MPYRRVSDGTMVADSEALDASGALRSGYAASMGMLQPGQHIGFDMAFMDADKIVRSRTFYDTAAVSLSDAESSAIIARAEMIHRTRNAYLGDRAPAFTAEQGAMAVRQAATDRTRVTDNLASLATSADAARAEAVTARAQMIDRISNAWKN